MTAKVFKKFPLPRNPRKVDEMMRKLRWVKQKPFRIDNRVLKVNVCGDK